MSWQADPGENQLSEEDVQLYQDALTALREVLEWQPLLLASLLAHEGERAASPQQALECCVSPDRPGSQREVLCRKCPCAGAQASSLCKARPWQRSCADECACWGLRPAPAPTAQARRGWCWRAR